MSILQIYTDKLELCKIPKDVTQLRIKQKSFFALFSVKPTHSLNATYYQKTSVGSMKVKLVHVGISICDNYDIPSSEQNWHHGIYLLAHISIQRIKQGSNYIYRSVYCLAWRGNGNETFVFYQRITLTKTRARSKLQIIKQQTKLMYAPEILSRVSRNV